jgi:hypothetical protein
LTGNIVMGWLICMDAHAHTRARTHAHANSHARAHARAHEHTHTRAHTHAHTHARAPNVTGANRCEQRWHPNCFQLCPDKRCASLCGVLPVTTAPTAYLVTSTPR